MLPRGRLMPPIFFGSRAIELIQCQPLLGWDSNKPGWGPWYALSAGGFATIFHGNFRDARVEQDDNDSRLHDWVGGCHKVSWCCLRAGEVSRRASGGDDERDCQMICGVAVSSRGAAALLDEATHPGQIDEVLPPDDA